MQTPKWHNSLEKELIRLRLPRSYRERLTEELLDHFEDLEEELMSTEAQSKRTAGKRLGSPDVMAQMAAKEYRRRPFYQRHPLALALLTPLPLLLVGFVGFTLLLALVGWMMGIGDPKAQPWTVDSFDPATIVLMRIGFTLAAMAPFAASAWIICRLARRFHLGGAPALLACTVVALVAVMFRSEVVLPISPGSGVLQFGLGYPASTQLSHVPSHLVRLTTGNLLAIQAVQAAVPLLIGLYFLRRRRNEPTMAA